jgi:hypothetical protein
MSSKLAGEPTMRMTRTMTMKRANIRNTEGGKKKMESGQK